ncbi:NUDIX domain-containing protein [Bacillus sp. ISL-40]|uniref:NUDIX hydrolase n=1 Tax=unclassified Bacillus (in: firmicutes) TaxID=185979 RepID=UPI001BEA251F|nr:MULTISPECIES: NUDIX domain-containing protein [unclassified Bacillus (in: firmicutes)]MBT2699921.1 NUDIX domain-containing protein [Bacillus sp. ISL-40]MBT2722940.1 NUDIX domain-containing protein [Bacillus sp. ISL-46]MBT2743774.1 NUDIX domain-containing protein [Bacillus sp. ISL-77]
MGYIEDLRKIVGNRPLILVGAMVCVIDDKGKILLQKRPEGIWGLPGGLLELGESVEEAGRREVFEETGVEIGQLQLVEIFSGKQYFRKLPNGDEFYPVTIAYVSKDIKKNTIKIDGKESIDAGFFPLHELPEQTSPLVMKMIQQYPNMLK